MSDLLPLPKPPVPKPSPTVPKPPVPIPTPTDPMLERFVEILPQYVPPDLAATLVKVRQNLRAAIVGALEIAPGPTATRVRDILDDRRRLLAFLENAAFAGTQTLLAEIGTHFQTREFDKAKTAVGRLDDTTLSRVDIGTAFTTVPVSFVDIQERHRPANNEDGFIVIKVRVPRTLPGYKGERPDSRQISQILRYNSLLSGGSERRFRMALLFAECFLGKRDFANALKQYAKVLDDAEDFRDEYVKFVSVRAAAVSLARGDAVFKEARVLDSKQVAAARKHYDAAIRLVGAHGVSKASPQRQQVEQYAQAQKAKLQAGFNAIGYKDSYVPYLSREVLLSHARTRREAAEDALAKFIDFRKEANRLDEEEARARLEADIAAVNQQIAAERREIAGQQRQLAVVRTDAITDQLDSLLLNTALSQTGSVLQSFAQVWFGDHEAGAGIILSGGGLLSGAVGYFARQNELENALRAARIEELIAAREETIANLEENIVELQRAFLAGRIQGLTDRFLNANLFYALSNLYLDLVESNLEAAIRWAFLYERAVAFKRLRPGLEVIQPDYRAAGLPAPAVLRRDLDRVVEADVASGEGQVLVENPISLRERYPIEFSRFLQTRKLDFTISLYDLDKLRPGVCQRRLRRVEVKVIGLIPATGYTGQITHSGFFTLRDRDSTMAAPRLFPLPADFEREMNELLDGNAQGDPVGGVIPFLMDEDPQQLSASPQPGETNPDATAVALFEGYGETGHWTLEVNGIDLRLVNDVHVIFTIDFPESDRDIQAKVEQLIRDYEAEQPDVLDKTAAFSLREQFPDAFDRLATGAGSFELTESDFPTDLTDLKVKTVVGQLIDDEGNGVEGIALEMGRVDGTFELSRTTLTGGFTEALDEEIPVTPIEQRVSILGDWQVRLADPGQFDRIEDLRLFLVYQFTEFPDS